MKKKMASVQPTMGKKGAEVGKRPLGGENKRGGLIEKDSESFGT